jgi:hypothetical protein
MYLIWLLGYMQGKNNSDHRLHGSGEWMSSALSTYNRDNVRAYVCTYVVPVPCHFSFESWDCEPKSSDVGPTDRRPISYVCTYHIGHFSLLSLYHNIHLLSWSFHINLILNFVHIPVLDLISSWTIYFMKLISRVLSFFLKTLWQTIKVKYE